MNKLIIHIGTSKTATSTLQVFFRQEREQLRQLGVHLPVDVSGGAFSTQPLSHHNFAWAISDEAHRPADRTVAPIATQIQQLSDEAERNPDCHTFIISSEAFFSPAADPGLLAGLQDVFDVSVVVYLRRQEDWLEANYATNIMMPYSSPASIRDFASMAAPTMDYSAMLGRWARVFGSDRIRVRPFIRDEFRNGDIVDDFFATCGVDVGEGLRGERATFNTRLGAMSLYFLKTVKPTMEAAPFRDLVREIVRLERKGLLEESVADFLSPELKDDVIKQCAATNQSICESFLPAASEALFPPRAERGARTFFDESAVAEGTLIDFLGRLLPLLLAQTKRAGVAREDDSATAASGFIE